MSGDKMKNNTYKFVCEFMKKFPKTIAFRVKKHAQVVNIHLNKDEKVIYAFCGQNNISSLMIINSCVVALTNQRIIIGQKRLFGDTFLLQ